jgi:cytochrome c553
MIRHACRWLGFLALMIVVGACNKKSGDGDGQEAPKDGPPGPGGKRTPIHDIMVKLAQGPKSLTPTIRAELQADPPPWDQLQAQTKEYTGLVKEMAGYDPPKGSKESWAKMSAEYMIAADVLDRAVQAKDKEGARAAIQSIQGSCMGCHRQHKGGPGGGKFPGPPDKGGFGPPQGKGPPMPPS